MVSGAQQHLAGRQTGIHLVLYAQYVNIMCLGRQNSGVCARVYAVNTRAPARTHKHKYVPGERAGTYTSVLS